ncbi:aspartyl/asparaginyl beta-hydroxylase domain-containing protein [Actinokineospora globicatena]|uniref:aspartyl/asparaginyl beta-hydroxylase domain-containing protein n=1 Tax=Actinokineospora globicatena TaxID=103729 RepID=UPI0020A37BE7|nr:aspartyl/asparaginyl beta-hydroxylase domain-containing protein [Actinokineospora globicatena]MCP2303824.1 Aspartyl/Asparaginyl beta-hydroxylase [Actinokineospora globicatena]GLW79023.1 hypothetical protein Aglo01_35050 [Actinokineospora globicatena]GLW86566.1 hypothetical protein Aglo02_42050 [Actinokineospora globicatena]
MSLDNPLPPTVAKVPPAVRLKRDYDADQLQDDLRTLSEHRWSLQRSYADDGTITEAEIDWRCLSLRSAAGNLERTDPGGPGLVEHEDTIWRDKAPYLSQLLADIPAELRAVRLLSLGPGAKSWLHNDTKYGPAWGNARLHVPVTTCEGAKLFMEGTLHQWQPGEFWFGDFSRMHQVENTDTVPRVHMVIDALVSEELLELFPDHYLADLDRDDVLINKKRVPLAEDQLGAHAVSFPIPVSFPSWEEEDGEFLRPQEQADATITVVDGALVLTVAGKPTAKLIHIGDGEFRFAGWTDERTIAVARSGDSATVTLRTRVGTTVRELDIAATPL